MIDFKSDEADNLTLNSKRRMPDYRGNAESRPQPKSTKSDLGGDAEKMQRILMHHDDAKIKIGDQTFVTVDEPEYESWFPRNGSEWSEAELPIKHHALRAVSGILLDLKKIKDKLNLCVAVPEFVLQMLIKAAQDYKALLIDPMIIVKSALFDYATYLTTHVEGEEDLSKEEKQILFSDIGLASLANSEEFKKFFNQWCKEGFTPPEGGKTITPNNSIKRMFQKQMIEMSRIESALNIVKDLGTFDVNDSTKISFDLASNIGLNTKFKPNVTCVEAYLLNDPSFRYFVDGAGGGKGSRVYYWDWVRNTAEHLKLAESQF